MARGGARPGAGRPRGRRSDKTAERLEAIEASGLTPLDFLLGLLRDVEQPMPVRLEAAKNAAQYIHPKLSAIDHTGNLSLRKPDELTDAELADIATGSGSGDDSAAQVTAEPGELH